MIENAASYLVAFFIKYGETLYHTEYMEKTGAEVLSIDYLTDVGKCLRMVNDKTVIMGNISPALLKENSVDDESFEVYIKRYR